MVSTRSQTNRVNATTHGKSADKIYFVWRNMIARCRNEGDNAYPSYGKRGIKVCDEWLDFGNFYSDMGDKPVGKTLDRIDNNGNYEPSNCRWATSIQQNNNKRNIKKYKGKSMAEWSRITGVKASTIRQRYFVYGWSLERAVK